MSAKTISNLLWRFFERTCAQGIQFIVTIVLARILVPEDFGRVAIITALISILQVFVDGGLGNALIQKKDVDEYDLSTTFFVNILICLLLYAVLFFLSPFIAGFYKDMELTAMFRVTALVLVISGIKNVQQAIVSKRLEFRKFFFATIIGTIISAVVGIYMALNGFGTWALIAQYVTNAVIDTMVLMVSLKWIPRLYLSFDRARVLFGYGWKLMVSTLIDRGYGDFIQLAIGRCFSAGNLAFYNRGRSIPNVLVTNINTSLDSVLFPVLSKEQEDIKRVKEITRRAIMVSNFFMAPLLMIIAASAESLVTVVLTEKWLPCVFYLRCFCIIYMMQPIHTANINAIKALGKSDIVLRIEIIKKVIGLGILLISLRFGLHVVMICYLIDNFINQVINSFPNKKMLDYSYLLQIRDIMPGTVLALISGVIAFLFTNACLPRIVILLIQILVGAGAYLILTLLFKVEVLEYIKETINDFRSQGDSVRNGKEHIQ